MTNTAKLKFFLAAVLILICFSEGLNAQIPPAPNPQVNLASMPISEQNNADIAMSEVMPQEIYTVWTEFTPMDSACPILAGVIHPTAE